MKYQTLEHIFISIVKKKNLITVNSHLNVLLYFKSDLYIYMQKSIKMQNVKINIGIHV